MNWYEAAQHERDQLRALYPKTLATDRTQADDYQYLAASLHKLFEEICRETDVRGKWDAWYLLWPTSSGLTKRSDMGLEISFGVSIAGWFVEANFVGTSNLDLMDDVFWARLASLGELGTFSYGGNGGRPSNGKLVKRLRLHTKSVVFGMALDAVLSATDPDSAGSGALLIELPEEATMEEVRTMFSKSVKICSQLNFPLYRSEYVQMRSMLKKHGYDPSRAKEMFKSRKLS